MAKPGRKKGTSKPEYKQDEKEKIVKFICDLYESQHCTLASAAEAAGIDVKTFLLWRTQNPDFAELFKKAKEGQKQIFWQDIIRPKSDAAITRLLEGERKSVKKTKGVRLADGTLAVTEQTVTEDLVLPNASVAIFVTKGLYPELFGDKAEVKHTGEVVVSRYILPNGTHIDL